MNVKIVMAKLLLIVLQIDRNILPISSTYRSVSVNKGFYISK